MKIATIGLDLAKTLFQVHGVDSQGHIVVRKQLRRADVLPFFAKLEPCVVGMGAWLVALLGPKTHEARIHRAPHFPAVSSTLRQEQQDRCGGCRSNLRGG